MFIQKPNPFLITGPAVLSFSLGRSSGYMLYRILQAHNGELPDNVVVCTANTGREMPASIRFGYDIASNWGVRIRLLEYRRADDGGHAFVEVGWNSLSLNGEPFEAIVQKRGFLPNTRQIFCSGELKTRTVHRFIRAEFGWKEWKQCIGLRADAPDAGRVVKARLREKRDAEYRGVTFPLHDAGITKADVNAFWSVQPFNLGLKGAWEGNCDGCLRKRRGAVARMFRDHPDRMQWWVDLEAERAGKTRSPLGAVFRKDWRGGYDGVRRIEMDQGRMNLDPEDDGSDPMLECNSPLGCGI